MMAIVNSRHRRSQVEEMEDMQEALKAVTQSRDAAVKVGSWWCLKRRIPNANSDGDSVVGACHCCQLRKDEASHLLHEDLKDLIMFSLSSPGFPYKVVITPSFALKQVVRIPYIPRRATWPVLCNIS
jgi:hypothetical protein